MWVVVDKMHMTLLYLATRTIWAFLDQKAVPYAYLIISICMKWAVNCYRNSHLTVNQHEMSCKFLL